MSSPSRQRMRVLQGLVLVGASLFLCGGAGAQDRASQESWEVSAEYDRLRPQTIAVLPMDNFSLEPGVEEALYQAVYDRLTARGYAKVSVDHVTTVMGQLGVTVPGLLAGFSTERLGQELNADALLMGQIEQSAAIHQVAYDAVVVSCTLRLVDAKTGTTLWQAQQWRAAHRQWALDPINIFINVLGHAGASRKDRVAFLVQEMLKTLPQGAVKVEQGDLLNRATVVKPLQ